ncbi:MAG: flavodoxin family protein [Methanoregulaceae archaeon]|jgi:flavodoxin|nr:flavodoxin family protein [Methanoregulaceae archaeon]MCU0628162.1 flavodoxin family protein [Methanoregulaceae archaeon]
MKILIVYKSYHLMNTEKIAKAMAEATNATLIRVDEVHPEDIAIYDLVGFGSGIYGGRHHKELFALVETMPSMEGNVFVFSTSGSGNEAYHRPLKEALTAKGCHIRGEFQCRGEARFLKFIRTNRGHPDEKDLEDARTFAKGLITA